MADIIAAFVLVLVTGGGDGASLSTVATFADAAACETAAGAVGAVLSTGQPAGHLLCVPADALATLLSAPR